MIKSVKNPRRLMLAGVCFLFVCILDYLIPFRVAGGIGVLYIAAILISMHESKKIILYTAFFATLLISLKFVHCFVTSHPAEPLEIPYNRILSIVGLWVAVIVALKSKKIDEQLVLQRAEYTETIEEIIYINSHKVRKPVTNIVKIIEMMEDGDISEQHAKQMMVYLRESAQELEVATKEMTDKITDKEYNQEILVSSSV